MMGPPIKPVPEASGEAFPAGCSCNPWPAPAVAIIGPPPRGEERERSREAGAGRARVRDVGDAQPSAGPEAPDLRRTRRDGIERQARNKGAPRADVRRDDARARRVESDEPEGPPGRAGPMARRRRIGGTTPGPAKRKRKPPAAGAGAFRETGQGAARRLRNQRAARRPRRGGWRQLHFRTDDNYTSARERGV
jgi:hypothetical protein